MNTHRLQREALVTIWRNLVPLRGHADLAFELSPEGETAIRIPNEDPWHQILVTDVFCQLAAQLGPRVALRVPVVTECFGIRVPDVIWMPDERWRDDDDDLASNPLTFVPDLCVEVLSGKTCGAASVDSRARAYLGSGAEEVVIVGADGKVEFRGREGMRRRSRFNVTLEIERPPYCGRV